MVKKNLVFLFLLIVIAYQSMGQVNVPVPLLFHGVVLDASTQTKLAGSEIYINKFRSVPSSEDGTFSFYAFKLDTIAFSMLGYKPLSIVISDTLSGKDFLTGIYLESDTIRIGEVIIIPKISNLKNELMYPQIRTDPKLENAVANINTASYVGRTTPGKLGDPVSNYEYIRQKSKTEAFEKGGIPSDRLIVLNPLILLPAAYLLLHGRPETPPPPKPQITSRELEELKQMYQESLKTRQK